MYFWNTYPFVRLSVVFILGIVAYDFSPDFWDDSVVLLFIFVSLFALSLGTAHGLGYYKFRHVNGFLSLFIFFLLGGETVRINYHSLDESHYLNVSDKIMGFSGLIVSQPSERTNYHRYELMVKQVLVDQQELSSLGKIHFYIKKDSCAQDILRYGDVLMIHGGFFGVPGPGNPDEFDYKKYLQKRGIYSQAFKEWKEIKVIGHDPANILLSFAYKIRDHAQRTIQRNVGEGKEGGIAQALVLGIKDHLDDEVLRAYSSAGAMHVLAVSGLHVGIVYLILQLLLGRLRATVIGRQLFGLISLVVIWLYAMVTGLPPSVLRAATMFSVMIISQMRSRKGNIYNTLGFAAFILLIADPHLIYSVGFQLSFAAVLGIVYLQPKIYGIFHFNYWIVDRAWAITCVSISAQLATFPLSAYYFHQFPTYFLVSNLVVIPSATIILAVGLFLLAVDPLLAEAGKLTGLCLSKFIWLINESVSLVERLPHSLIEWIYLDQVGLILVYGIVLTLIWSLHHSSFKTLIISAVLLAGFSGWNYRLNLKQSGRNELIFYEIAGKTAIDHIDGFCAKLFVDELKPEERELLSFQIDPHRLRSNLTPISLSLQTIAESENFKSFDSFTCGFIGSKRILIIDKTTFKYEFNRVIETDIILLENESVKSLRWLDQHFIYDHLVIGNKNADFYVRNILKQAKELDVDVHVLKHDGALILRLD